MPNPALYDVQSLREYVTRFFVALNVPETNAKITADVLVSADLRGINSHGVIRIHSYYGKGLITGQIEPGCQIKTIRESPTSLALDGGNGLGQVVGYQSMHRCIALAKKSGLAITTVRNSNHFGIAGYYAMMALPEDMIGISLTNSKPLVAQTYGLRPTLGTNPIAVAIPAGDEKPYVLDMATSIVSIGRIAVHEKAGQPIPEGWGINQKGKITQHPSEVLDGGALMPLGGPAELRGYKGYGLSLLVDLFSGVLSGAAYGEQVGKGHHSNVGHFFAAIKIENFRSLDRFKADMDDYIQVLKNVPRIPGEERIFIHGEKEFEKAEIHQRNGVPLLKEIVDALKNAGKAAGVPFDLKPVG